MATTSKRLVLKKKEAPKPRPGHCQHCAANLLQEYTDEQRRVDKERLKLRSLLTLVNLEHKELEVKCPRCRKLTGLGLALATS